MPIQRIHSKSIQKEINGHQTPIQQPSHRTQIAKVCFSFQDQSTKPAQLRDMRQGNMTGSNDLGTMPGLHALSTTKLLNASGRATPPPAAYIHTGIKMRALEDLSPEGDLCRILPTLVDVGDLDRHTSGSDWLDRPVEEDRQI